jgi:hypothetical protein
MKIAVFATDTEQYRHWLQYSDAREESATKYFQVKSGYDLRDARIESVVLLDGVTPPERLYFEALAEVARESLRSLNL